MKSSKYRSIEIYCDESRIVNAKYMVLGGVLVDKRSKSFVSNEFFEFRKSVSMFAEFKWTKVSRQKISEYKSYVDVFFNLNDYIHFKSMIIKCQDIDNKTYNNNDKDLGFYKLYYQFLLHAFKNYIGEQDKCFLFLDKQSRKMNFPLTDMKRMLNLGIRKKYKICGDPYRNVNVIDSKSTDFLQIADVLMGGLGYKVNNLDLRPLCNPAKNELSDYIIRKSKISNIMENTPINHKGFSVWYFKFYPPI